MSRVDLEIEYLMKAYTAARNIDERLGLAGRIGVENDPDLGIFHDYLAARTIRTGIYNRKYDATPPRGRFANSWLGKLVLSGIESTRERDLGLNKALEMVELSLETARARYANAGLVSLPGVIERAVNDLTAKSSVQRPNGMVHFEIDPKTLDPWSQRWKILVEEARTPGP